MSHAKLMRGPNTIASGSRDELGASPDYGTAELLRRLFCAPAPFVQRDEQEKMRPRPATRGEGEGARAFEPAMSRPP